MSDTETPTPSKRGRKPGTGRRLESEQARDVIRVRPADDELKRLERGAVLAGRPPDGRRGGKPALASWILDVMMRECDRLERMEIRRRQLSERRAERLHVKGLT